MAQLDVPKVVGLARARMENREGANLLSLQATLAHIDVRLRPSSSVIGDVHANPTHRHMHMYGMCTAIVVGLFVKRPCVVQSTRRAAVGGRVDPTVLSTRLLGADNVARGQTAQLHSVRRLHATSHEYRFPGEIAVYYIIASTYIT